MVAFFRQILAIYPGLTRHKYQKNAGSTWVMQTAKVIKGARRGKDPAQRYAEYKVTVNGKLLRRAMHPEFYMHSWSQKVKKNRKLFATVMEEYKKLDIVTKQAYTEAIFLRPKLPIPPITRRTIDEIRRRWKNRPKRPPGALPSYFPWPAYSPPPATTPNPNISPEPWPYPGWEPWPNEYGTGDHYEYVRKRYGEAGQRRPNRSPVPTPWPNPEQDINKDRNPTRTPTRIVIKVTPESELYELYKLKVWAQSEYSKVERFIKAHKEEVIIIVVFGAIITLGWSLIASGAELSAGEIVLANPEATSMYPALALLPANFPIEWIDHYFYKELIIDLTKPLNITAFNYTRMWQCYREIVQMDNEVYYNFYQGPDAEHKGELAAIVKVTFNLSEGSAEIDPVCGPSNDEVAVYMGNREILHCNPRPVTYPFLYLYNFTKQVSGEARITQSGNLITYAFEDRPIFGDGDYNDAYGYIQLDNAGNVTAVWAKEGEHCDEIAVYYGVTQIGYYPQRC